MPLIAKDAVKKANGTSADFKNLPRLVTSTGQISNNLKEDIQLIEGAKGGKYTPTSVQSIVKKAAQKAGVKSVVTPHMLRHSFATHLLEDGIDLRYIQTLLGHNSSLTTEIYTHVATNHIKSIQSPLDSLNLK